MNTLFLTIFRFNTYLLKYPRFPKLQKSPESKSGWIHFCQPEPETFENLEILGYSGLSRVSGFGFSFTSYLGIKKRGIF